MTKKKRISQMTDYEIRTFYRSLFKQMYSIVKGISCRTCFDCGKKLTVDDAVLMCDSHGFLQFCYDCSWHRIKIKETWRKIFQGS